MKKCNIAIRTLAIYIIVILGIFNNHFNIESVSAKDDHQLSYNEELKKSLTASFKKTGVVRWVTPNYYETLATFWIDTTLIGNDKNSKRIAERIKSKANEILISQGINGHFDHYFIYVYDRDGENLIDRPVNHSFEKQINHFGKKLTNKIPQRYTLEDAKKNGDILQGKLRTKKQTKRLKEFKHNVTIGKPDFIRMVQFNQLGDALIREYQFNGKLIYYRYDSSRDSTGTFNTGIKDNHYVKLPTVKDDYCKELVSDFRMSYITKCYKNDLIEF